MSPIPEAAHFALVLAFFLSLALAWSSWCGRGGGREIAGRLKLLSGVLLGLVGFSFAGLAYAFLRDDFSVALVALHSHSRLPVPYKFSAVWGNHEGSLLLWVLVLSAWTRLLAGSTAPLVLRAGALAILGLLLASFIGFSLFTSNPFARLLLLPPAEGGDLNPLLQDPAMVLHPPLLYIGYVGFALPFALAVSALLHAGTEARRWAQYAFPWAALSWAFLSLGIALGSWWAYYELGWGGWWFWDPVENASFMPWLAGVALLHSLRASMQRGQFHGWSLLLAIACFGFSLLGAFLVRSGVLVSVHSFAADPARGLYLLLLLVTALGGALALFRFRAPVFSSPPAFALLSRESALLLNNLLLVTACLTVLVGTLFPLVMQSLGRGLYSVGPPYFNTVFVPLLLCISAAMGPAPALRWGRASLPPLLRRFAVPLVFSLALGILLPWFWDGRPNLAAGLGVAALSWLSLGALRAARSGSRAMLLAHLGFALCGFGICFSVVYGFSRDLALVPGERLAVTGTAYELRLAGERPVEGANYRGVELLLEVFRDGVLAAELRPQKRRYPVRDLELSEAAISAGLHRDLYAVAGARLAQDGGWTVRFQYKPFVRLIWLGGALMAAGGFWAVAGRRRRR